MNKTYKFTSKNAINYILFKIPKFESCWVKHKKYWGNEITSIGIDVQSVLELTENCIKQKDDKELKKIFNIIEEFIIYGDEDLKYATTIIFLENLIFDSNNNPYELAYGIYISLLGTKSREFIRKLDRFWNSKTPGIWNINEEMEQIYWPTHAPQSIAEALRLETYFGIFIDSKTHLQKAICNIKTLSKWLILNISSSASDIAAAESVLKDLQDTVSKAKLLNKISSI